ncbi:hypothetical protein XENTR_v10019454 [Xenopus tropicalis]|nr:hypothetical protein XENTR_v10019454 [Xenopus tropicalis]
MGMSPPLESLITQKSNTTQTVLPPSHMEKGPELELPSHPKNPSTAGIGETFTMGMLPPLESLIPQKNSTMAAMK